MADEGEAFPFVGGVNEETFRLLLDGVEVPIIGSYTVHAGVLEVPSAFEISLGHAAQIAELADRFPAGTPFQLMVGDTVVQTGETDGYGPTGRDGSELAIRGRDMLKWLVDCEIPSDRTFSESTFAQLTELALAEVGLGDAALISDNTANRKAITGSTQVKDVAPPTTEETQTEVGNTTGKTKTVYKTIKGEIGTTWWNFLAEQYKRAGLFLWAAVDGSFVLTRPNGNQPPVVRIVRRRGTAAEPGEVTVLGQPAFEFDITERYTGCYVTGLSGGGKDGHGAVGAWAFDREMVELLNPGRSAADIDNFLKLAKKANPTKAEKDQLKTFRRKDRYIKDKEARTVDQAQFHAFRKIVESRRNGWSLSYKVAGHTAPAMIGGGRVIWAPDIVVLVQDDELGIEGPMYLESCVYERKPQTTTTLNLMRIEDLVFAEEDLDRPPQLARKKGVANIRVGKTEVFRVEAMWRKDPNWGNLPVQVRPGYVGLNPGVGEKEGDFVPDVEARRLR